MPFLFWLPLIVMSGMWSLAQDDAPAATRHPHA
jgi:hypothetical protein